MVVHLTGLEGTNPLGYLAALGVQVAFASEIDQPRLWWSDDITPHAIVDSEFTMDRISEIATKTFAEWSTSVATNPKQLDGSPMQEADKLKLKSDDIRIYLHSSVHSEGLSGSLATALVAEGSLNKKDDRAKPTALNFMSGQQKFLDVVRKVLSNVKKRELLEGLQGEWKYESELGTLMWDIVDDRGYALSAYNPSNVKKLSNPGPEALAILGLSLHPVFAGPDRTLTQGCSEKWKTKNGYYSYPLWRKPATLPTVKSLLAHAYYHLDYESKFTKHSKWFNSWGVFKVLQCRIERSSRGYGTIRPPEVVWQRV